MQVAERTERVYDYVQQTPTPNILDRIKTAYTWGPLVGVYGIMYTILEAITLILTEILFPVSNIDVARTFNTEKYNQNLPRYGDHELYVDNTDSRQKKAENRTIDQDYESVPVIKPFKRQARYQTVRPLESSKPEISEVVPIIPKKVKMQEVAPLRLEPKKLTYGTSDPITDKI